jgi:hypothetical protein
MIFVVIYGSQRQNQTITMQELHEMETHELIELLAYMTGQLTSNISEKNTGAVQQFEYDISMIQSEINSRQQNKANTNFSDPGIEFTAESN